MAEITISGVDDALDMFSPVTVHKAAWRALNDVSSQAVNTGKREIAKEYNITYKRLTEHQKKGRIRLKRATIANLEAEILVTGHNIPLSDFVTTATKEAWIRRQMNNPRKPMPAISVKVRRRGGSKKLRREGTMILKMKRSGYIGIFERTVSGGKRVGRLPIETKHTIDIATMFKMEAIDAIGRLIDQKYGDRFWHHLRFYRSRGAA